MVDLVQRGFHLYQRVKQTGRADNLLDHHTLALLQLVVGRGGADIYDLSGQTLEFLKPQRAVVEGRLQAEAVVDKILLARKVAAIHRPYLRHRHMALVNYRQVVFREIVKEAEWPHAGFAAVEVAAVILDAGAMAHLAYHLYVIGGALVKTFCLKRFSFLVEKLHLLAQVKLHLRQRRSLPLLGGDEKVGRVNLETVMTAQGGVVEGMEGGDGLDFIPKENHAQDYLLIGQADIHRVSLDAEITSVKLYFVAAVKRLGEPAQERVAGYALSFLYFDDVGVEVFGVPHAEKA